jgi:hypothetical protein
MVIGFGSSGRVDELVELVELIVDFMFDKKQKLIQIRFYSPMKLSKAALSSQQMIH